MKAILSALMACAVAAFFVWLKYRQAQGRTPDLGDGEGQPLFPDDSKK
jgi:hypothetical protein